MLFCDSSTCQRSSRVFNFQGVELDQIAGSNGLSNPWLAPLQTLTMTSRKSLFMRRATLGLLLLAHLFLQVQVAIACVVENLPGVPCEPGAAAATEHSQNDKTVEADCCQAAYQPAAALYDASAPPGKDVSLLTPEAPVPVLIAYLELPGAPPLSLIPILNATSLPGVLGTKTYLTTLRLRI